MEHYDYIIVGAGSAGCVLADQLSACGRYSVLLLEAGGSDRRFWVKTPIGYGKTFHDPSVNWRYRTAPDPGLGGRSDYWPRGKVLGGSSSINAMVYSRGLPSDYEDWRAAGNPGWGWEDVAPVYAAFERRIFADGSASGDGPLHVSDREGECHPIRKYFLEGTGELGLTRCQDVNGPDPEGVGAYQVTTRRGLRCSAADAFLRPAMRRKNLRVVTHALAERITFDGKRATGVVYRGAESWRSAPKVVFSRGGVIVSAGAINSPKLLQLSGIGPGAVLQRAGVGVLHAAPGVGGHLQDHLGINYFYQASEPTLNQVLGTWPGRIAAGMRFVLARQGPLSMSINQMGGMVRSAPERERPDLQLYFNPLSYSVEYKNKRPLLKPDREPGFVMGFNSCRPSSLGRVEIASADPAEAPHIVANYLSTNKDLEDVLSGARLMGRLAGTSAMRRLITSARLDLATAADEEIIADFRARSGSVYHQSCTCRMAPEAEGGVVDVSGKVYGVNGLRVVDTSVFPNVTSANTNAPAIMVAHKMAAAILSE